MRYLIPAFLFVVPMMASSVAPMLPMENGNMWIYRDARSGETRTVYVGTPLALGDGRVYYSLRGYVGQRLWARNADDGTLLYYDEETGEDRVLTGFPREGWMQAGLRECDSETQVQRERRDGAAVVAYRTFGCADAGTLEERYVENLGMVMRSVQTIAGPRTFELEYARVGKMVYAPRMAGWTHVEATPAGGSHLRVVLRLVSGSEYPVTLRMPTGQRYEIVVRNERGEEVWRWSDGKAFTQAAQAVTIAGYLQFEEIVPLTDSVGRPLPPGQYSIEGMILGGAYAATTEFRIYEWL